MSTDSSAANVTAAPDELADLDALAQRFEAQRSSATQAAAAPAPVETPPATPTGREMEVARLLTFLETPPPPGLSGRAAFKWLDMQHLAQAKLSRLYRGAGHRRR